MISEQKTAVLQRLIDQFPTKLNRENISRIREIFDRNSEFFASKVDAMLPEQLWTYRQNRKNKLDVKGPRWGLLCSWRKYKVNCTAAPSFDSIVVPLSRESWPHYFACSLPTSSFLASAMTLARS
jgi:hypothetical protein